MGAGCAFRSLVSEPGWRAETIAIHNKGFGPRAAAEQSPRHSPGGRGPPLGNDMPKGSSHCPILGQAHVWTPALWGSGAKGVRAREAPRPGCLPLCGSHLSNQSVAANCSAALSPPSMRSLHLPQPRHPGHLQRRAQVGPSDPRARGPCQDPSRHPAAAGGLIHPLARRGGGGETRIPAGSKPELLQSPGWRATVSG